MSCGTVCAIQNTSRNFASDWTECELSQPYLRHVKASWPGTCRKEDYIGFFADVVQHFQGMLGLCAPMKYLSVANTSYSPPEPRDLKQIYDKPFTKPGPLLFPCGEWLARTCQERPEHRPAYSWHVDTHEKILRTLAPWSNENGIGLFITKRTRPFRR